MLRNIISCAFCIISTWASAAEPAKTTPPAKAPTPEAIDFFERKVRPILLEHCVKCHGEKKQNGALRLDTAPGLSKGSDTGPVVVPGQPDKSKLILAVKRSGDYAMPPDQPLPADAVAVLVEWVKQGAVFPSEVAKKIDPAAGKNHWAFQPVKDPPVPTFTGVASPIDAFVRTRLVEKKLTPAKPADRRTLFRRATFDLIGLPPSADEVEEFVNDDNPNAYETLVDRLLASPRYGERWARHWLDVARYSDTKGYVFMEDRNFPYAYTFRDYVIRSLNDDLPFDRFVIEQLAADRLPLGDDKRPLAALGFLTLGRRFLNNEPDIIDDRIDVVTRGLMGLSVGCARCHDHKYDPIPIGDYYSLYGVFKNSPEAKDPPLIGVVDRSPEVIAFEAEVQKREQVVAEKRAARVELRKTQHAGFGGIAATSNLIPNRLLNSEDRRILAEAQRKVDEYKAKSPVAPPRAHALQDAEKIEEPVIFLRGNKDNRGARVPRRMPEVVAGPDRKNFTNGSGRLEFSRAIVDPKNPLTARVFVNRVWAHYFGQGLVRTPSDFGTRSDPPTHPELLDWLASRFIADGWSIKKLHKRILLSETYRLSSDHEAGNLQADPENRWLSRQTRRRLEFEPLRDSLLQVAGNLDLKMSGKSVDLFVEPFTRRRTVYGFIERQNLPGTFRAFDLASPDQHSPMRFQTTVPQQALFLMNHPFLADQARVVAARTEIINAKETAEKVRQMYRLILSRNPTREETSLALEFVNSSKEAKTTQLTAWEQLAQVLLLSNEFAFVE